MRNPFAYILALFLLVLAFSAAAAQSPQPTIKNIQQQFNQRGEVTAISFDTSVKVASVSVSYFDGDNRICARYSNGTHWHCGFDKAIPVMSATKMTVQYQQ
jgi:hypothetical protein